MVLFINVNPIFLDDIVKQFDCEHSDVLFEKFVLDTIVSSDSTILFTALFDNVWVLFTTEESIILLTDMNILLVVYLKKVNKSIS